MANWAVGGRIDDRFTSRQAVDTYIEKTTYLQPQKTKHQREKSFHSQLLWLYHVPKVNTVSVKTPSLLGAAIPVCDKTDELVYTIATLIVDTL